MDNRHERAQSMMPDYSKSFAVGGSKKFVNITLPGIINVVIQMWRWKGNNHIKNNPTALFAQEISQPPLDNIIAEYAPMQPAMIVRDRW